LGEATQYRMFPMCVTLPKVVKAAEKQSLSLAISQPLF